MDNGVLTWLGLDEFPSANDLGLSVMMVVIEGGRCRLIVEGTRVDILVGACLTRMRVEQTCLVVNHLFVLSCLVYGVCACSLLCFC